MALLFRLEIDLNNRNNTRVRNSFPGLIFWSAAARRRFGLFSLPLSCESRCFVPQVISRKGDRPERRSKCCRVSRASALQIGLWEYIGADGVVIEYGWVVRGVGR